VARACVCSPSADSRLEGCGGRANLLPGRPQALKLLSLLLLAVVVVQIIAKWIGSNLQIWLIDKLRAQLSRSSSDYHKQFARSVRSRRRAASSGGPGGLFRPVQARPAAPLPSNTMLAWQRTGAIRIKRQAGEPTLAGCGAIGARPNVNRSRCRLIGPASVWPGGRAGANWVGRPARRGRPNFTTARTLDGGERCGHRVSVAAGRRQLAARGRPSHAGQRDTWGPLADRHRAGTI
jgi:type IV secretory pathway TrbD component